MSGVREWKVRSMSVDLSEKAVDAAERDKVTVAVWLGRAIRQAIDSEREPLEGVIEAGRAGETGPNPVANPAVNLLELLAIASEPELPRWLRAGAARHIGSTINVHPPAGRPGRGARRLAGEGAGRGDAREGSEASRVPPSAGTEGVED